MEFEVGKLKIMNHLSDLKDFQVFLHLFLGTLVPHPAIFSMFAGDGSRWGVHHRAATAMSGAHKGWHPTSTLEESPRCDKCDISDSKNIMFVHYI